MNRTTKLDRIKMTLTATKAIESIALEELKTSTEEEISFDVYAFLTKCLLEVESEEELNQ